MRASSKATGPEWCSPTAEVEKSKLLRLVAETRRRADSQVAAPRPRKDSGSGKPLEDAWFCDSSSIPVTTQDSYSKPLELDPTGGRFKIDAPPPPPPGERIDLAPRPAKKRASRKTRSPVYPVYKDNGVVRVLRVLLWLGVLGAIGVGVFVTFEM